jgi:hypothetical protein
VSFCVVLLAHAVAGAQGFRVGAWQAYGLVNMADVNRYIVDSFNNLQATYGVVNGTFGDITSATAQGLDAGYEFYPGLILGARLAQVRCSPGTIAGTVTTNPVTGRVGNFRISLDSSVIPYMVGGSLRLGEGTRFSFAFAVYLGYALGSARLNLADSLGVLGTTSNISLQGSGIADDVSGELRYKLTDALALGLSAHLMTARIAQMDFTQDIPDAGVAGGTAFRDQRNNVLAFDYSNIALGIGLYLSF